MGAKDKSDSIEAVRKLPFMYASQISEYDLPAELNPLIDEICHEIESARKSSRGVSSKTRRLTKLNAVWLLNCLRICYENIPRCSLALPQRSNEYGPKGVFKGHLSYIHTKQVLQAMERMGLIKTHLGMHLPDRKGHLTRINPTPELAQEFAKAAYIWAKPKLVSDLEELVVVRNESKKQLATPKTRQTNIWRKNLIEINDALTDATMCLWLRDDRLLEAGKSLKPKSDDLSAPFINYRNCQIRRIFSRGKLDTGGRFYGGWWQIIPSELRRHIYINGMPTVECDYSGMSLRLLYAKEAKPFPLSDPYDIGIPASGTKRKLIKKFINAQLNDEAKRFRLGPSDYAALGVSHEELSNLIYERHSNIAHHFGTGIGLQTQFMDSCIAEEVMLNMIRGYNTVVLPIHDSFIVRQSFQNVLETEMQAAFEKFTGIKTKIKSDRALPDPDEQTSIDMDCLIQLAPSYEETFQSRKDYSIAINYTESKPDVALER